MRRRLLPTLVVTMLVACSPRRPEAPAPASIARSTELPVLRELPPAPGTAKDAPFPTTVRSTLPNGLTLAVVPSHDRPIVEVRLLVKAGRGWAGPAVTELTASLLKDGGTKAMPAADLIRRVETLGADVTVHTDFDGTALGWSVAKEHLPEALRLLAQVVREPRLDAEELRKLKKRVSDAIASEARASGSWAATRVVLERLFDTGPRADTQPLPSEVAKVDLAALREFYKRFYAPRNVALIVAGDVDDANVRALAEAHFGSWTGPTIPERPVLPATSGPRGGQVVVIHRPKSARSDVRIGLLGPPRTDERWPSFRVANAILGGGVGSRLFADVREGRSVATDADAAIVELEDGAQPLLLQAATETSTTVRAVGALLDDLDRMRSVPPTDAEVERARRYIDGLSAVRQETLGAVADAVVVQETLGLPEGTWEHDRAALRRVSAAEAAEAAKILYKGPRIVVVAGDADVIAGDLAIYGDVTVVDPTHDFQTLRTLPKALP